MTDLKSANKVNNGRFFSIITNLILNLNFKENFYFYLNNFKINMNHELHDYMIHEIF